jgi:hypothetical protein
VRGGVQVERDEEGDEDLCEGCEFVEVEEEEGDKEEGGGDLEDVKPEVAAVDAQVDQVVVRVLRVHRQGL